MPFVKLDTGILNSTLWFEKVCREVFITALLMAEPFVTEESIKQIQVRTLDYTGWSVPPGWYGFVYAAGTGILHRALIDDEESGLKALEQLGSPEESSRSQDFEGRRLVRVDGGYIVLNFAKYRDRDYTSADRSRRWRERQKRNTVSSLSHTVAQRDDTVTSRKQKQSTEAEVHPLTPSKEGGASKARPRSCDEVKNFCESIGLSRSDGEAMWLDWEERGFGKTKDWKAKIKKWKIMGYHPSQKQSKPWEQKKPDLKQEKFDREYEEAKAKYGHGQ